MAATLWPEGWSERAKNFAARLGLEDRLKEVQLIADGFSMVTIDLLPGVFNLKGMHEELIQLPPGMWPGPLAAIVGLRADREILDVSVKLTDYGTFHTAKRIGMMPERLGPEDIGKVLVPLSFGAVSVTKPTKKDPDGRIVFGIRTKNIDEGGKSTTLPSGFYNPETDKMIVGDLREANYCQGILLTVFRELKEEVGIDNFTSAEHLGLAQDCVGSRQPLLAMRLGLPFTAEQLYEHLRAMGHEVQKHVLVPNNPYAVREFIEKYEPTPHDVAKLILHFAN